MRKPGYDLQEMNVRAILIGAFICILLAAGMFWGLAKYLDSFKVPQTTEIKFPEEYVSAPGAPQDDLLFSYGWTDKKRRRVHIPISRAIELGHGQTQNTVPAAPEVGLEQKIGDQLPTDLVFTDDDGHSRKFQEFLTGQPTVLVFTYFRCPNLCSLILNGLVDAVRPLSSGLGKNFNILTVSIDPEEKLITATSKRRSYLARLGRTPENSPGAWHFLIGNESAIKNLSHAAGFYYEQEKESREFRHPSALIVLTPAGKISRYFPGIHFNTGNLDTALREARLSRLGALAEEIVLNCFHYDPRSSPHGALVLLAIRIFGIATVAGLLIFFIFVRKGESRS